ncbi:MAG: hypothetical protein CMO55_15400 [Verrucomicrobiales bacterium]|nr:hypothetical protein [Verrucomicrobiales bacterium]
MTYQDVLDIAGGNSSSVIGTLATRTKEENPNHHLWNNRGTWWCHFTLHRPDFTAERVRVSLKTRNLETARSRRDELLNQIQSEVSQ